MELYACFVPVKYQSLVGVIVTIALGIRVDGQSRMYYRVSVVQLKVQFDRGDDPTQRFVLCAKDFDRFGWTCEGGGGDGGVERCLGEAGLFRWVGGFDVGAVGHGGCVGGLSIVVGAVGDEVAIKTDQRQSVEGRC